MLEQDFESQNFAIFEDVVHTFGTSENDIIYLKKCLFPIDAYLV